MKVTLIQTEKEEDKNRVDLNLERIGNTKKTMTNEELENYIGIYFRTQFYPQLQINPLYIKVISYFTCYSRKRIIVIYEKICQIRF